MQDKKFIRFIFRNGPSDLLIRKPAALLYASGVNKIIFLFTPITTGSIFSKKKLSVRLFQISSRSLSLFDSFNEAEYLKQDSLKEPESTEVVIPSYHRKKTVGKRESDLSRLPARIIEHTLSDEELATRFPDGYKELPEEIYKRLHIIPETFIVDEHHVHVYASKNNDGTTLKAPRPKDLFRNSIVTPALVASIINDKYTNALPLEQQSKTFKTNGIQLSSNTMANWVTKVPMYICP